MWRKDGDELVCEGPGPCRVGRVVYYPGERIPARLAAELGLVLIGEEGPEAVVPLEPGPDETEEEER